MLIAEVFVLLALDAKGRVAGGMSNQPVVAAGVTGALVCELAQRGHLSLPEGRIHLAGGVPEHPLLAKGLELLAPHEGKKLKRRLGSVRKAGWNEVVDSLVAGGVLGRERHGMRPTRHPVADAAAHQRLLQGVREAATGDGPMDPRTATLLALAGPCHLLEVVAPSRADRPAAKRRIAAAAEQAPAADALQHVIVAVKASIEAAAVGPVISSG